MKKYLLAFVLLFSLSNLCVMAQENNGRKKMDKSEFIQKQTERMAERYGLDENQTKELLDLNTQYTLIKCSWGDVSAQGMECIVMAL